MPKLGVSPPLMRLRDWASGGRRRGPIPHALRRAGSVAAGVRRRWRRSLQLRMVTYTVVASSILVTLFGVLVVSRTTSSLVHSKLVTSLQQIQNGATTAKGYLDQLGQHDESTARSTMGQTVVDLAQSTGGTTVPGVVMNPPTGLRGTSLLPANPSSEPTPQLVASLSQLAEKVGTRHLAHQYISCAVDGGVPQPCLAVGMPVSSQRAGVFQLFYVFPLTNEQTAA